MFYSYLAKLPYWGHYKSQVAMDREWAIMILDQEEKQESHAPLHIQEPPAMSPLGYDEVVARLDLIAERLQLVQISVEAQYAKEGQRTTFKAMDKPVTAYEQEREKRTLAELYELDRMVRDIGLQIIPGGWGEDSQ